MTKSKADKAALAAAREQAKQEREAAQKAQNLKILSEGKMPFGKHAGVPFEEIDLGYLNWLLTCDKLDGGFADVQAHVRQHYAHLALPVPDKTATVGKAGQDIKVTDATVIRKGGYNAPSFDGRGEQFVQIISFCTKGGACLVVKSSGQFVNGLEVGDVVSFTGKIKFHDEYNGQAQTVIARPKRL